MGAKRKVDEKLYAKIKKELKSPKDDKKVMKKYKLGQTVVRAVRNSWCYDDYLSRTKHKRAKNELSTQERAQLAWIGFVAIGAILLLLGFVMIVRWILSLFGI